LNWSRWVAAWLVVAEHARSLVFLDYGELHSPGLLAKGFYFLTGFGHEAVIVFFVISGYLVGGKVWSLYREGRFGWKRYLADRASRLYAVLLVALMLGAALDWSGYLFFNQYGLYNHGYEGSIAVLGTAPIERMGWRDFLVNAFFLQTIAGPTFGSNGPLWSLAYEWWYYILFPAMVALVFRRSLVSFIAGGVLSLTLLFLLPADIIWLFGIWLLGVMAAGARCASRSEIGDRRSEDGGQRSEIGGEEKGELVHKSSGREGSGSTSPERIAPVDRRSEIGDRESSSAKPELPVCEQGLDGEPLCGGSRTEQPRQWGVPRKHIEDGPKGAASGERARQSPSLQGAAMALASKAPATRYSPLVTCARISLAVLFFMGALILARVEVLKGPYAWQYLLGVAYALVVVSLAGCQWRLPGFRPSACLADFSYSVYLIHFPVLMFVLSLGFEIFGFGIRMPFSLSALAWYGGVFASAILMSWVVSQFTEARTASLRVIFYKFFWVENR
jgi:peptidoglycan/LPS O-acetylase OafA/YrhL